MGDAEVDFGVKLLIIVARPIRQLCLCHNIILLSVIVIDFSDVQKTTISLLFELTRLRDNYLVFSCDYNFNHSYFLTLSNYVSSVYISHVYSYVGRKDLCQLEYH